jgi:prolyl-tRNA synthetase
MVPTDAGEDYLVRAEDGSYAANLERAEVGPLEDPQDGTNAPLQEVHTPGLSTIEEVSGFLGCRPRDLIKTIIYEADGEPLVALVRGDHEVNESKLARAAGLSLATTAEPDLIKKVTGAEVGFAGPVGLTARTIADQAVTVMHDAVTGANKTDYHITGVNAGRDYEIKESADIRTAVEGDRAPNGSPLIFEKCIEVGHVFKLGAKYSEAMQATYLDPAGKSNPMIMGCYGIGLNRIMAAAIEAWHDDKGICWPMSIAPFQVVICALDTREEAVNRTAERLHDELESAGVDVLLDDRDARPGFKFNDADLIGFPIRVVVGKRGLADGIVELRDRHTGEVQKIPPENAANVVAEMVRAKLETDCRYRG